MLIIFSFVLHDIINIMTLFTKAILSPKSETDGLRISVMSRHTFNDGITPNPEISDDTYDEWIPELAPSLKLIGSYYKRGLSWDKFSESYEATLHDDMRSTIIQRIASRALNENVTLMCIEESPDKCHRRLLAEECKRIEAELEVMIK